jgi:hypothetical protein
MLGQLRGGLTATPSLGLLDSFLHDLLLGCHPAIQVRYGAENDEAPASVRLVNRQEEVTSVGQAAAVCNVTPPVVRRWLSLGLISGPPWTLQQLHDVRDMTDPQGQ